MTHSVGSQDIFTVYLVRSKPRTDHTSELMEALLMMIESLKEQIKISGSLEIRLTNINL